MSCLTLIFSCSLLLGADGEDKYGGDYGFIRKKLFSERNKKIGSMPETLVDGCSIFRLVRKS